MAMDDHQQGELDKGTCLGSGVGEEVSGKTNTQAAFLESNRGRTVVVKLNSDLYYRGVLAGLDMYMNISLVHAEEYVNGQLRQTHGVAIINGKGVLDISIVASEENQNRTERNNTQDQQFESSNTKETTQSESSNTKETTQSESSNTQGTTETQSESSNTQHQQPESSDKRTNKEKMRARRRELESARLGTASKGFRKKDKHTFFDP